MPPSPRLPSPRLPNPTFDRAVPPGCWWVRLTACRRHAASPSSFLRVDTIDRAIHSSSSPLNFPRRSADAQDVTTRAVETHRNGCEALNRPEPCATVASRHPWGRVDLRRGPKCTLKSLDTNRLRELHRAIASDGMTLDLVPSGTRRVRSFAFSNISPFVWPLRRSTFASYNAASENSFELLASSDTFSFSVSSLNMGTCSIIARVAAAISSRLS